MEEINSIEEADTAQERAYQLETEGRSSEAFEIWKAMARFDPELSHGLAVEKMAEHYEDTGDLARADLGYRVCMMLDPGYYQKMTNYAGFLIDSKRYREAYALLKSIEKISGPTHDDVTALLNALHSEAPKAPLNLWDCEPLDPDKIIRATREDLERFLDEHV